MNRDADALCRRAGPPVGAEPSPSLRVRPDGGRYHCGETVRLLYMQMFWNSECWAYNWRRN